MGTIDTVSDIIRVHGAEQPDRVALVQGDRRQTWGELYGRACQVANLLAAAGVGPEDRVAFLDKNGIEHFEVFFGAALLNAVSVDVNWRLAPPEVEYIVNDAEAKVFVVGPDFVPVLEAIRPNLLPDMKVLVIGQDYEPEVSAQPATDPGVRQTADDVAFSFDTLKEKGVWQGEEAVQ